MCLGVAGKIKKIDNKKALVHFSGTEQTVSLALVDKVRVGDYVLVHAGFAIAKIDKKRARENEKLINEVLNEK